MAENELLGLLDDDDGLDDLLGVGVDSDEERPSTVPEQPTKHDSPAPSPSPGHNSDVERDARRERGGGGDAVTGGGAEKVDAVAPGAERLGTTSHTGGRNAVVDVGKGGGGGHGDSGGGGGDFGGVPSLQELAELKRIAMAAVLKKSDAGGSPAQRSEPRDGPGPVRGKQEREHRWEERGETKRRGSVSSDHGRRGGSHRGGRGGGRGSRGGGRGSRGGGRGTREVMRGRPPSAEHRSERRFDEGKRRWDESRSAGSGDGRTDAGRPADSCLGNRVERGRAASDEWRRPRKERHGSRGGSAERERGSRGRGGNEQRGGRGGGRGNDRRGPDHGASDRARPRDVGSFKAKHARPSENSTGKQSEVIHKEANGDWSISTSELRARRRKAEQDGGGTAKRARASES